MRDTQFELPKINKDWVVYKPYRTVYNKHFKFKGLGWPERPRVFGFFFNYILLYVHRMKNKYKGLAFFS